jgi:hypothetical protein
MAAVFDIRRDVSNGVLERSSAIRYVDVET